MIRRILVLAGAVTVGYGAFLLLPQFWAVLPWLAGGPLIHDLMVAPLVGSLGAFAARRRAVAAGLAVTGTLLLIAVPLLWRPHPAPPNPGLLDRDYLIGLTIFLGLVWALAALATLWPNAFVSTRRVSGPSMAQTRGEQTGSTEPPLM